MSNPLPSSMVHQLTQWVGTVHLDHWTDAELVDRFLTNQDSVAYSVLLKRYGSMIYRLCLRMLSHEQDAEDVFQATFLILAQKASSLRKYDALGPWLYGVASRLSKKCRESRIRREKKKPCSCSTVSSEPIEEITLREAERIVHEELAQLPERYRSPIILCYLEGKTRDEAASILGYSLGTFKDRLARGKQLLQGRLSRRGITSAFFVTLFQPSMGISFSNIRLLQSTSEAALAIRLGTQPPVSEHATSLLKGGLKAMKAIRIKIVVSWAFSLLLVGSTVAIMSFPGAAEQPKTGTEKAEPSVTKVVEKLQPGVDTLGDPLPPGAIARLGTRRHRVPSYPSDWYGTPDGKSYLIYSSRLVQKQIQRIDADSGKMLESWTVPQQHSVVGFSPDRKCVLYSTEYLFYSGFRLQGQEEPKQECKLILHDLEKRQDIWMKSEMLNDKDWKRIDSCLFSLDGKWLVTSGRFTPGQLRMWDTKSGMELWHNKDQVQFFQPLGFTNEEKTLVTRGTNDNYTYLFDSATGKQIRSFPTISADEHRSTVVSPDGRSVLMGTTGTSVRVWNIATGKEQPALEGHKKWGATTVAFSRDGKILVTGGNQFAQVREWPSRKPLRTIDLVRSRGVGEMEISGDGKRLQVLFWGEQAIHFYDLESGKQIPNPLEAHYASVYGIGTTPDGKLVSFGEDSSIRTWDLATKKAVHLLPVEPDLNAGGFAMSKDGMWVAVPSSDIDHIHIYNRTTNKRVHTIKANHWGMKHIIFSPDARWVCAFSDSNTGIQVWEVATGKEILHLKPKVAYGISCAFSPDGKTFAMSDESKVRFWDLPSWKELSSSNDRVYAALGLTFSPDNRTYATASVEGIRIYELATQQERTHIRTKEYPYGSLCFSPNGRFLAWVTSRTNITVWDLHKGVLVGVFSGHDDTVTGLTFTNDSKALVSSSEDSTILVWDISIIAGTLPIAKIDDTDKAWELIASSDGKVSYEVIRKWIAAPQQAIERISKEIRPVLKVDSKQIESLFGDLDSPQFKVREKASRDLEQFGEDVVGTLKRLLQTEKLSPEARQRVEKILDKYRNELHSGDRLRQTRALEILEAIGTKAAIAILESFEKGAQDARLTEEAKSSLARITAQRKSLQ